MADGVTDLLSVKEWLPANAAEVSYTNLSATQVSPPASGTATVPVDSDGKVQTQLFWRFGRIQAHDGNLLVGLRKAGDAAPTLSTGNIKVFNGTSETLQIPPGGSLYLQGETAATKGAVIWGR